MLAFGAGYAARHGTLVPFWIKHNLQKDEFTDKDIRNYTAYNDMNCPLIPTADNKIPEAKVWQLNQPAYMREYPAAKISEIGTLFTSR